MAKNAHTVKKTALASIVSDPFRPTLGWMVGLKRIAHKPMGLIQVLRLSQAEHQSH
jgi:hypothetical protein